jgi:hypothetical protein
MVPRLRCSPYRDDGTVVVSPVWFRTHGDAIEVVVAEGDGKLARLRDDPRCLFTAFETTPPFGGVQIRAEATLDPQGVAGARLEIAGRYLGAQRAARYVAQRTTPGVIVRLPLRSARRWDLSSILPDEEAKE